MMVQMMQVMCRQHVVTVTVVFAVLLFVAAAIVPLVVDVAVVALLDGTYIGLSVRCLRSVLFDLA